MSVHFSKTVYFFDIDETLFRQENGLIHVLDYNGKVVESISNETYNTYKLKPGYSYDFSEFQSSNLFIESATAIEPTIKKLQELIDINKTSTNPDLILILTARGDFDDKEKILAFFDQRGLPIRKYDFIQFVRTGNITDTIWSTPVKKQAIVLAMLITNRFNRFVMFDDSIHNLEKFYEVKKALINESDAQFELNHVIHDVVDGKHVNYQIIEVKDENAVKYIEIYRAKRTLEKYNIPIYDPSVADVKIGKREIKEDITENITESTTETSKEEDKQ